MTDSFRKQVVLAAGIGSQSGDTRRLFGGFRAYLMAEGGYRAEDFHEATYGGEYEAGRWVGPAAYDVAAFDVPLATSVAHCAQALLYWARQAPAAEWHLVGYSLGGLVLLEAAIILHRRAHDSWGRHLRSATTLSAPLNGCQLGEFRWLGDLFGPGAVGPELCALGDDLGHRRRLEADVAALRAAGVTVTTLVEADDVIVQPDDGIVGEPAPDLIVAASSNLDASPVARYLGHGRIVHDPRVWRRLLGVVGPQVGARVPGGALVTPPPRSREAEPAHGAAPDRGAPPDRAGSSRAGHPDPLDQELAELKARLRAEGRLPPAQK
jgi:hypothetical protein